MPSASTPRSPAASTQTFRLTVAYDGTDFFGWQVQPGLPTVQGTLAHTIREITGEDVLPQGSGRTDTGVHARGQVVSVSLHAAIPAERLLGALNRRLPSSVRILAAQEVDASFHARANVLHKTYEYLIFQRRLFSDAVERICPPQVARYVWDCRWPLDIARMQAAASDIVGTHDLTSFAASDPDRSAREDTNGTKRTTTRSILEAHWSSDTGRDTANIVQFRIRGTGFLHHTVRILVGTMVEIGTGRFHTDSIGSILAAKDRRSAGMTAPPQGLHLAEVRYVSDFGPAV